MEPICEERTQVRYIADAGDPVNNFAPPPAAGMKQTKNSDGFFIGSYEVTGITGDGARVGCQLVTRAQVKELYVKMDLAKRNFERYLNNLSPEEARKYRDILIHLADKQNDRKDCPQPTPLPDGYFSQLQAETACDAPRSL